MDLMSKSHIDCQARPWHDCFIFSLFIFFFFFFFFFMNDVVYFLEQNSNFIILVLLSYIDISLRQITN